MTKTTTNTKAKAAGRGTKKVGAKVRKVEARKTTRRAATTAATETRSVIKPEFRSRYGKAGNNGDETAVKLADYLRAGDGDAMTKLRALAEANGVWNDRWATLNVGMVRMNLGNRLRAAARKGTGVKWPAEAGPAHKRRAP